MSKKKMYGMATTSTRMVKGILLLHLSSIPPSSLLRLTRDLSRPLLLSSLQLHRSHPATSIRCASSSSSDSGNKKVSSRLSQVHQLLNEAEHRYLSADIKAPIPKITLDHVTVNFARSGGPGGQNVNKVNTKVDMRFNVENAYWLSERVREKIMQMEKNRINKDGELVISSTKTRTQKGNVEDALAKLQEIIDAASYVPPPPSEEQKKKIAKLAAIGEHKRLKSKKVQSDKKAQRRSKSSWD